ncbi:MAG: cytochrome P450 [Mycobacteriaceae bacterium]
MNTRRGVHWAMQHGVARLALARSARSGDVQARLLTDPQARENPYPLHDELRAVGPLVRGRLSYVSATHAVCSEVLRSDDFRTGDPAGLYRGRARQVFEWSRGEKVLHPLEPPSLLAVQDPDHTRYRALVGKVFTARAVAALRGRVQDTADQLLDDLSDRQEEGQIDVVRPYCTLLPLMVISDILGVDDVDRARVLAFGEGTALALDAGLSWRQFAHVDTSLRAFDAWLGDHLARLRRNPGADLLSQLVTVTDEGRGLAETELRSLAGLLLAAGFETTVNLLSSGTDLLLRHPDQLELLQRQDHLWPNAVEEVLRHESPVQMTGRVAVRDTTVGGHAVPAGSGVATLLAGANRDPAVFTAPHRFDVGRDNAREHLAFSAGRHFCLGAALARIEGEVGLRSLFHRFPDLAAAPGAQRRPTRVLRGWATLPVRLGLPDPLS